MRVFSDQLLPAQKVRYSIANIHEPEEEAAFIAAVRQIPPGGCFVNIGSAVGYYLILARCVRSDIRIHGFEPLEKHRKDTIENLELNNIPLSSIVLYEEAVSSRDGESSWIVQDYSSRIPTPVDKLRTDLETTTSCVKTIGLNSLVARLRVEIDLVQMDVQGAEYSILSGGQRELAAGSVRRFLIGTHGQQLHTSCQEILEEYGYGIELSESNPEGQPDGILMAFR